LGQHLRRCAPRAMVWNASSLSLQEASNCGPEWDFGALSFQSSLRRTAIATTAPIQDPSVEACLAQLLDHFGIAGAAKGHFDPFPPPSLNGRCPLS
jgi:hypothetical protein